MLEQYYKAEDNQVLFSLYQFLCEHYSSQQKQPVTYSDICDWFNRKSKSSTQKKRTAKSYEKISTQDVAHYCKKLEKCGFVSI